MTKKNLLFLLPFFLFACGESPTATGDEEEFIGVVFRDNDASSTFSMSILDFDL